MSSSDDNDKSVAERPSSVKQTLTGVRTQPSTRRRLGVNPRNLKPIPLVSQGGISAHASSEVKQDGLRTRTSDKTKNVSQAKHDRFLIRWNIT